MAACAVPAGRDRMSSLIPRNSQEIRRFGSRSRRSILSKREAPPGFCALMLLSFMTTAKQNPKTRATKPPPFPRDEATSSTAGAEEAYHSLSSAIGASAGGLEAATILLKELSPDLGMAYIVVLHLDPARESAVTEILGRATRMPVVQVTDGMRVAPDHVYVIPPNCEMTIARWVLHLGKPGSAKVVNTTIDTFLRSLAIAHGQRCDRRDPFRNRFRRHPGSGGDQGEAGITFAQEPSSAKYDGMPASAIASGCVDFILTPAGIAKEIARIRHHPYIADRHQAGAKHVGRRKRSGADISLAAAEHHGRFFGIQIAHDRAPHPAPHGAAEDREAQRLCQLTAARTTTKWTPFITIS